MSGFTYDKSAIYKQGLKEGLENRDVVNKALKINLKLLMKQLPTL